MSEILVKDKEIVVPGEILAKGMDFLPAGGAIREGENIVACRLGLISVDNRLVKVIPLTGRYIPKSGDMIVGEVAEVGLNGWRVEFGWAFQANISLKDGSNDYIERGADLTRYYTHGDLVVGKIVKIAGPKIIDLTMKGPGLRKLGPGRIIEINPQKVPRVIGKAGSMISMIKEHTGCNMIVGQNGRVWLSGTDPKKEALAVEAIRMIEEQSHISGLTDAVKKFLEKEAKK
ncbi:MAG: exosome complex protein Rrp4 [Nanoarchaeota archaeon]|nr:exosome complex protein Rrp4 [Nanoarchaeota archaeon]MBU1444788.1 exosome complex protein Rrp4 [Nanoarchaeota archaeon]MBU2406956.1 exosome complex protein Rrp4 [Nanoarchaeota archaeon]MBU2420272.1 exosome complex protein Rrp4 [Nanoarchaeota archaeon]MBU2475037.1 exosome complex protein Rrp4 [Nanoarchaeota archaeon]